LGLKVSKKCLYGLKNFRHIFQYGYQNNPEFYAAFEAVVKLRKICYQKYRQYMCEKLEFVLFYTTNLQKFLAYDFSECIFSNYLNGFEISVKILFCAFLLANLIKFSLEGRQNLEYTHTDSFKVYFARYCT
jgi:hypothetical protein